MVHHLLNATDKAIIKYHEVSIPFVVLSHTRSRLHIPQALSVDPINGHVIELLNLALESDTVKWQVGKEVFPGGSEAFEKTMLALRAKYTKYVKEEGKIDETAKSGSDDEMVVG